MDDDILKRVTLRLLQLDANHLYGVIMLMPLPYGGYKWMSFDTLEDIKEYCRLYDEIYQKNGCVKSPDMNFTNVFPEWDSQGFYIDIFIKIHYNI